MAVSIGYGVQSCYYYIHFWYEGKQYDAQHMKRAHT